MKKLLGNSLFTIMLSLLLTTITLNWAITGNPAKSFLTPHSLVSQTTGIKRVDVEFSSRKIYLSVYLERPLSCKNVIDVLGIGQLSIKAHTYVPTCTVINDELIKITYNEAIQT